ncbi:MAG: fibronectin type III domain-containing protein, partial [Bacteroidales bacterium]|nr:fibronectin type III domain-containing protein [Bacteroidales bacterium]
MKKFLLFILSVFFLLQMGHTQEFRASAVDELSLVYYFSALDGAFNSVATDENHFYLGSWLNNRIAQHNMDGSNGRIFYMNDVYGLRDLTFDGTFFYGVNATMNIYKMNLADDTLVAVIPVTMPDEYELRHISYDPTLDGGNGGFWVGGNNSMGAVSMSGAQLKTLVNFNDVVVGTALDPYSDPQNPFLWLMTQVVDGHAFLRKFDINTQMINTFSHDCQSDLPNIPMYAGGGLFSYFSEGIFRLAVNIQNSPNLVMIYDIIDLTPLGVPAQVPNLTVAAGANGSLNAIINWTNPSLTYNGETLNEITAVKIYEGNTLIHTVTNVTPGQNCTYTASVPTEGSYTYKVVPENSAGTGPSKSVESPWIGHDMPAAPQNPLLTTVDNNISWTVNVSWTAPQTGLHDGYFTNQNLVYDVYRMPAGTLVSSEQTGLTFTETVTELGTYLYKIIAKNHIGTGGSSNTNA